MESKKEKVYSLYFSKSGPQLLVLIAVPLAFTSLVFLIIILFRGGITFEAVAAMAMLFILSLAVVIWLINNKIEIPVEVTIQPEKVLIRLQKTSFFYKFDVIDLSREVISGISRAENPETHRPYIQVYCENPDFKFILSAPRRGKSDSFEEFWTVLKENFAT